MATAFAVFCATDGSLTFYNRDTMPAVGSTFESKIVSNVYTNVGLKKVGEKVTFKINPDNFCEYFNEKSKGYLIVVGVGVLVICFILPLLIYVLKNGVVG